MLTSWAFEMEFLILGWYILVETGSVVALTIFGSLMFIGTLVAPMFGVFGDRIGHRNLLAGMRAIYAVLATTMMTLALTGLINPVYVFILVVDLGPDPAVRSRRARRAGRQHHAARVSRQRHEPVAHDDGFRAHCRRADRRRGCSPRSAWGRPMS